MLKVVFGRDGAIVPARLSDHKVTGVTSQSFPMILKAPGDATDGAMLVDVTPDEMHRLDYYEATHAYDPHPVTATVEGTDIATLVYVPRAALHSNGAPWDLAGWADRWGPVVAEAAEEVMADFGSVAPEETGRRYPQMLMRAASRLRAAADPAPMTLRHDGKADTIHTSAMRRPYSGYFGVVEHDLRFPRFDGGESEDVTRAGFMMADTVTVVPYDPVRDRVLVIEQFRYGAFVRGDPRPWMLEPVAGRIDPGEAPEDAVRRECVEEAGLTLGALHLMSGHYPSPAAVSEYLYTYIGLAELPDEAAGLGGLADEHEDIRAHVIPFDRLMALVESGEAATGPLVLSAYWLAHNRRKLA
ncbi:MAG: NUDIX domain-containing protein [Rhodobacteraceae bacterium]|nr:NUDIX domain-containing protein [Alphaproteobacteria bacterium]NNK65324.1 NUDIX domain-containing protein [Paracoccaceae bacterium]